MPTKRRGHNEGSIHRRGDGRWVAVIALGVQDGRRVRKYLYARTRAEVTQKLRDAQAVIHAGLPVPDERLTVAAYLEHWLTDVLPESVGSVNTLDNYAWAVRKHLVPALGHKRLVKLTPADVAELLRAKATAGMAKSSLARLRSVLVAALAHAVLEGLVVRNVAALVRGPRGAGPDGRSLTHEEALALLRTTKGERLEAAFVTTLVLGLRPGEVLGLRWDDVDEANAVLHIRSSLKRERNQLRIGETKTRKSRRALALPRPVLQVLKAHRRRQAKERIAAGPEWRDEGLVFCTTLGTPIDPSNFRREFTRVTKAAGLGHWHPHELRHSAVSLLSAAGVPIEVVADVMGHSTTRTTEAVYRHTVVPATTGAREAMERLFPDT